MKSLLFCFILLLGFKSNAYHPCNIKHTQNELAESVCFSIPQSFQSPIPDEKNFNLQAVMLTESIQDVAKKDTMILIPGGPGNDSQAIKISLNEKDILNALWKHNALNVVLFDPRGTGASQFQKSAEHYPQETFYTDEQVSDLKQVIDATSPDKPVYLLAHSAGGNTAARFAYLYPKRVLGMIMYSTSLDVREIGESNLRLFSHEFKYWQDYLNTLNPSVAQRFDVDQQFIESFLRNTLKSQRLLNQKLVSSRAFYLKDFRVELVLAVENSQTNPDRVSDVLFKWKKKILDLPLEKRTAIDQLADLKFTKANNTLPSLRRGLWIKTAVICSEGITHAEMKSALWLEGLNFEDDTCHGVRSIYRQAPSKAWISEIKARTLFLGGSEDPSQIMSAVHRNASLIENSSVKIFEGGGHEAHLTHSWEFYQSITEFLSRNKTS